MQRREFIGLVGGAAAWPFAAWAQQSARMPRLGVLVQGQKGQLPGIWETFTNTLRRLGWSDGDNIQIDYRFAENDPAKTHALAVELVSLKPDIIFAVNTLAVAKLQHETRTIPIIFVSITDPVTSGFVASLSHPGGNITGFSNSVTASRKPSVGTYPDWGRAGLLMSYANDPLLARISNIRESAPIAREEDFALLVQGYRLAGLPE